YEVEQRQREQKDDHHPSQNQPTAMPSPHRPRRRAVQPTKRDQLEILTPDNIPVQSIVDKEVYRGQKVDRQQHQIDDERQGQDAQRADERLADADAPRRRQLRVVTPLGRRHDAVEEKSEDQHRHRREERPGEHQRREAAGDLDRGVKPGDAGEVKARQQQRRAKAERRQQDERRNEADENRAALLRSEQVGEGETKRGEHRWGGLLRRQGVLYSARFSAPSPDEVHGVRVL